MKLPKDKNGRTIQAGDTIRMVLKVERREFPGRSRVAIHGMSGNEVIVPDEGKMLPATTEWADYLVKWSGACLVAERVSQSENAQYTAGSYYLNSAFRGEEWEVMPPTDPTQPPANNPP